MIARHMRFPTHIQTFSKNRKNFVQALPILPVYRNCVPQKTRKNKNNKKELERLEKIEKTSKKDKKQRRTRKNDFG